MSCYVGPKEFRRLSHLAEHQDKVMQFGWSKPFGFLGDFVAFVGKLFYTGLCAIQYAVVNWGLAIIVMTILIRLVFWPLTAKAADSSRKMARLQKPLKEIQEKYKDDPKKRNEATLELWKKNKVNPLAGCLPVLIQIPIFIAFYYMLRGASELRFAHFLWINDLSLPDTVAVVWGFPLNIMPLLMGVSMFYQMHLAPSPSTDPMQAKIMKFMPLIFLFFCYMFSSGLVLYWTISNCMSIIQQLHTNHKRDLEEAAEAAGGGTIVNAKLVSKPSKGGKKKK
jgi:YidC/Oxa1 family membrane protein insertase